MSTAVSNSRLPRMDHNDAAEVPRIPRRRRWWLLSAAVVMVATAGYGNYALLTAQDERVDVLVLTRNVGWGQAIADTDLGIAKAVPDQPLASVLASDRAQVVGRFARSTLSAGTVLAPTQIVDQPVPGPGEQLIGLSVKPGHLPARGLGAGDLVQVSPVTGGVGTAAQQAGVPFRARVLGVGPADSSGAVTVDVVVGVDAAAAASSAAAGSVVIAQLGPGA